MNLSAACVRAAVVDVVLPELETRRVGLSVEEVKVLLPDEEARVEVRVPADRTRVVLRVARVAVDRQRRRRGRAERRAQGVRERDAQRLGRLGEAVVGDEDGEGLTRRAGGE